MQIEKVYYTAAQPGPERVKGDGKRTFQVGVPSNGSCAFFTGQGWFEVRHEEAVNVWRG